MPSCPACSRETAAGARFCAWCATPMNVSGTETAFLGAAPAGTAATTSIPRLSSTSAVDEGRFLPGTVLAGRYRIAGLLGRGGMGEVYRATDLTLGQAVALKFLPETTAADERALARFYNEVRVARQVTHPNVCRVYDVGQTEGLHYISMEFVDGEDLGSLLRRIGRIPVDKALETARKLCAGLAAAHEKGVLHRDLKPANIMIDGRGQVVIMDFGLAGLAEQLQGDVRSGTPAYMSPEQLAGTEVTVKSDLYALGLLLYEVFTGKRAFEASSLIELMQMQERAAPQSISTIVHELDPGIERVIMRCLHPDPRQRPASALAVAAGLPGGDPLAAALAAGETPSPELVAAAGETDGLAPKVAISWAVAGAVAVLAAMLIGPGYAITSRLPLETPPEGLARDARAMLRSFGYTAKPVDTGWGFTWDDDFIRYSKVKPKEAEARWNKPTIGQPPLLRFWYREGLAPLAANRGFNVYLAYNDPPMEQAGMLRIETDPDGKLLAMDAVPPQVEKPPATPPPPPDWSKLFQAAALDMAAFQPTEPVWTPLANWDARAAWTGTDALGQKLRIEASAWRGRPNSFRMVGPWTVPGRMNPARPGNQIPFLVVIYIAVAAACILAWVNLRAGRSDRRGAMKLTIIYFLCDAASRLLQTHHNATTIELQLFWLGVGASMINAVLTWVFYIALEPAVRRHWPRTIVGWNRFTAKGISDPLVGRDLLCGIALGTSLVLLTIADVALHGNDRQPLFPPLNALTGVRSELAALLSVIPAGIFTALLFFFLIFLLRAILRKEGIAAAAFVAIVTLATVLPSSTQTVDLPIGVLSYALLAFALLRFGLLAGIVTSATSQVLPIAGALDFSAWHLGMSIIPILVVLGVLAYGFHTSLGGRPLFKTEDV